MPSPNILKMVVGERVVNGTQQKVYYLGTWQTDGWVYFNDDRFWRYEPVNGILQIFYISKEIWVETNAMTIKSIGNFNIGQAQNMIHGGGAAAENASVENAVLWAIDKVTNNDLTYDETNGSARNVNSNQYNCSTLVITAFWQAGFPIDTATYTGNMIPEFEACGFEYITGTYWDAENLLRGDIQIWNIPYYPYGHTNIYIGNNQDVDSGSANPSVITHTPDNFGRGWDGILRYVG